LKKSILIPILLVFIFSCLPDEETQAPTNTVQTTTPEPEPVVVQYTLTVTEGEGGTVSSEGGTYDEGTEVTITASANVGYRFTGWEGNSSTSESLTVTLNSNQTYQALFELIPIVVAEYTLSITAGEGGTVSTEGGTYDEGTEVTISATANEGYRFTGWEGNSSTSESLTVTLNSNQTYQALFELITYTLTVTVGEGGTVSSEGGEFEEGTEVTIIASPTEGYVFTGWEGNNSTSESLTVTLNSNITLNAIFKEEYNYEYNQLNLNNPPFDGTIFITGDIITSTDPSLFSEIEYKGTGSRQMYDRRNGGSFNDVEPHLFDTSFSDGLKTEIQVNPEFTLDEATVEANKYAFLIGQLPTALRKDVETMWIHKGIEAYGGGNNNLLVHTGMSEEYENNFTGNIIEETLIHEATHTSIDNYHYPNGGWTNSGYSEGEGWINAVENDKECYISTYARDFPYREDLAELMPLYVAVRYFPERISSELRDKILSCNINRIKYLDSQNLDMSIYED
tara:strand:+ start:150 stop:1676 length:1527 start_codon:yes stop_codon:yes gene_type:complete